MSEIIYYNSKKNDIVTINQNDLCHGKALDIDKVIDISSKETPLDQALEMACEKFSKFNSKHRMNNTINRFLSIIEG